MNRIAASKRVDDIETSDVIRLKPRDGGRRARCCLVGSATKATFALICAGLAPAFAGSVANATITEVTASINGFFIYVTVAPTGVASCGTQTASSYRFAVSVATATGPSIIATALSAQATGAAVDIGGTGACDVWPDTETINFITKHS